MLLAALAETKNLEQLSHHCSSYKFPVEIYTSLGDRRYIVPVSRGEYHWPYMDITLVANNLLLSSCIHYLFSEHTIFFVLGHNLHLEVIRWKSTLHEFLELKNNNTSKMLLF